MKKYWIWLLLLGFCLNGCGKDMPGTEQIMPLPVGENLPDLETVSEETIPPETVQEAETAAELSDMPEEEIPVPTSCPEPYIRMLSGEEHFSCTMLTLPGENLRWWTYDENHMLYMTYTYIADEKNRELANRDKHLYLVDLTTGTIAADKAVPGDAIWNDAIYRNGAVVLCHFRLDEENSEYHADNPLQIIYTPDAGALDMRSVTNSTSFPPVMEFAPYPREYASVTSPDGRFRVASVQEDGMGRGGLDLFYPDGSSLRLFANVTIWDTLPNGKHADIGDVRGYSPVGFLDDTWFVYTIGGWEWTVGYGIFDLMTGTTQTFDGSIQGIHEGQIYLTENQSHEQYRVTHIYKTTPEGKRTLLASWDPADGVYWLSFGETWYSSGPVFTQPYWYDIAPVPADTAGLTDREIRDLPEVISIYSPDLDSELARVEVDRYSANHLAIRDGQITYVVQEN